MKEFERTPYQPESTGAPAKKKDPSKGKAYPNKKKNDGLRQEQPSYGASSKKSPTNAVRPPWKDATKPVYKKKPRAGEVVNHARPAQEQPAGPSFNQPAKTGQSGNDRPAFVPKPRSYQGDDNRPKSHTSPRPAQNASDRPAFQRDARPSQNTLARPAYVPKARPIHSAETRSVSNNAPRPAANATDRPAFVPRPPQDTQNRPGSYNSPRPASYRADRPAFTPRPQENRPVSNDSPPPSFHPVNRGIAMVRQAPRSGTRPQQPVHKPPTPARRIALEALVDVSSAGAYSTLALDKRLRAVTLPPDDRRLVTALFYGTIEKRMAVDYVLSKYMERLHEDVVIQEILRMAVYQLFYMDVPDYATCGEAVSLARAMGREPLCPLINAVCRKIAREKETFAWPEAPQDRLSIETSTPPWLIRALMDDLGEEEATAFLSYQPLEHHTSIRVNTMRMEAPALAEILRKEKFVVTPAKVADALYVQGGGLADTDAFRSGLFSIQGEASMLAVHAMGVKGGYQVLDACAAPGGKSFLMAELMKGSGRVHAIDLHQHRVLLIEAGARRLGLDNIRCRVGDASDPMTTLDGILDAVLVDAPCSGLGVLGKSDIKYRVTQEQLDELPTLQLAILQNCAKAVKPGGTLVYSTCTVFKAENQQVVEKFLQSNKDFALKGLAKHLPAPFAELVEDGMLTLKPQRDGTDGFFIARMERKK